METEAPGARLLYQLGGGRFLGRRQRELFILESATGKITPLAPGNYATPESSLLAVSSDQVFFLSHGARPRMGYDLSGSRVQYERASDTLSVAALPGTSPHRLFARRLEAVVGLHEDSFLVITAGPSRELWLVPAAGAQARRLAAIDRRWIAPEIQTRLSPGGRYLALAAPHDGHSFHDERELAVIELSTGRVVLNKTRLPTDSLARASSLSQLSFGWHDDKTVFVNKLPTSSTYFDVESGTERPMPFVSSAARPRPAATGGVVHLWSEIEELQNHGRLAGSVPRPHGCFDLSWGKASYLDAATTVCDVTDQRGVWIGQMSVSDDGRWAACSTSTSGTILVDGATRHRTPLLDGTPTGLRWLPGPEWVGSLSRPTAPGCNPE